MKIKQLIKKLSNLNQEAEVLLSSDGEGNSYGILETINMTNELKYYKQDYYEFDVWDKSDIDNDFTLEDYNKGKDCIVLYPN